MLIGIDASRAVKKEKTGTEYYSQEIIHHILNLSPDDKFILYAPYLPDENNLLSKLPKNAEWKIMPFPRLWSQIRFSWELFFAQEKPYVIFEPAHTIPFFARGRMVVTIHDLGFMSRPDLYPLLERLYLKLTMRYSAKRANKIIAYSEFTKSDLVKYFHIKPEKINVIHLSIDKNKFNLEKPEMKLPEDIRYPYIFYIGRLEVKKNIINLLKSFEIALKSNPNLSLVLSGKWGFGKEKIENFIQSFPPSIKEKIITTGYIEDKKYLAILKNSAILSLVTNYEGFGIPVLEAMASGIPVVCSNNSALPEIAGDSALLVDPNKPEEIAQAFVKATLNPEFKHNLINKGLKNCQRFDWQISAKKTLETIRNVY